MSVDTTKVKEFYDCNGTTTAFSITFPIFAAADVVVCVVDSSNVETTLTLNTDYTVTLTTPTALPSLGHIDLLITAPAAGNQISIYMDHDYTQEVVVTTGGPLPVSSINEANDRAVLLLQQLKDAVDRSVKMPRTYDGTMPTLDDAQSLYILRWNSDCTQIECVSAASLTGAAAASVVEVDTLTMSGDGTLTDPGVLTLRVLANANGAARNYDPSGTFTEGFKFELFNVGSYPITFDSTGIAAVVGAGQIGYFYTDGTSWYSKII